MHTFAGNLRGDVLRCGSSVSAALHVAMAVSSQAAKLPGASHTVAVGVCHKAHRMCVYVCQHDLAVCCMSAGALSAATLG